MSALIGHTGVPGYPKDPLIRDLFSGINSNFLESHAFLNMIGLRIPVGSGDSSLIAGSSSGDGLTAPVNDHLIPGSSACGDGQRDMESSREKSDQIGSSDQSVILSKLAPKDRVSCDIGMFNHETSAVEHYPNVTLEVLQNSNEKRSLTVKHIDGDLPDNVSGTDFKVDWGMLSSMRFS